METNISLSHLKEPEFFPEIWKTMMTGVVVFVDVRSGSDNRSKSVANEMERLGATVVQHFSKKVTHVIFKDGSKPIYDKAKILGIPIVSYLWVVACKEKGEMVSTEGHEAINTQDYDSEFFKWRKVKSMQPKGVEEELALAEKRLERRRKKRQSLLITDSKRDEPNLLYTPYTPVFEKKSIIDKLIESSPACQERIHQDLASGKSYEDVFTLNEKEEEDFDTFFDTPLMLKFISKNYYSPLDPTPSSVSKILDKVRQASVSATTPSVSGVSKKGEDNSLGTPTDETVRVIVPGSPLAQVNSDQASSKRKTRSSMSSVAKKRKENTEDVGEKLLRRKLLFQPKKLLLPQDPVVALTPDESPRKLMKNHPCFSQVGANVLRATCGGLSHPNDASPRRDSLDDFKLPTPKKRVVRKLKNPTLVCTSIHTESMKKVEEAIEQMNRFKLIDEVDDSTTHVVCGDSRRTLNVMRGVVRGAKIVTLKWITDSMVKGKFLNEDDYPVERFSAAALLYRKKISLFGEYEAIYVSLKSVIPSRDLCDMIKSVGGNLTSVSKKASIIVGQINPEVNVPCVNGTWILDCIEQGVTLPLTHYLMYSP